MHATHTVTCRGDTRVLADALTVDAARFTEAARRPCAGCSARTSAANVPHRLKARTKEQLYARAQELEVEGRSGMMEEELIEPVRGR